MPRAFSTLKNLVLAAFLVFLFSVFPEIPAAGDTFAARFAGALAAISTVMIPITVPLMIPMGLSLKTGIFSHSPPMTYLRIAQIPQDASVAIMIPKGIAFLHQFNASSLTMCLIWALLVPIQRSIPKY